MQALKKEKANRIKGLSYWLACISVFLYIVSAIAFEITKETAFISSFAIYFVFVIGLFYVIQNNKLIINEYVFLLLFLCMYIYFSTIGKITSNTLGLTVAYYELTCAIVCIFVFWLSSKYSNVIPLAMIAYVLGAIILSVRVLAEYGGIRELIEFASEGEDNRVGGLLGNENAIGLFLANGILCCLIFSFKSKRLLVKIALLFAVFSLGVLVLLTGSRKSLAFVLIGIVLIVFANYRKAKIGKKFFAFLVMMALLAVVYSVIGSLPMFATINERLNLLFEGFFGGKSNYSSDEFRKMMIEEGLVAFYEKPIFGHGAGYSYVLFGTYSHNNFVELLMNYGLVGFVLYYGMYAVLVIKLLAQVNKRNANSKGSDIYAIYFLIYIGVQLILGIGWVNYYDRPVQIVTALAFGYLFAKSKEAKGKTQYET